MKTEIKYGLIVGFAAFALYPVLGALGMEGSMLYGILLGLLSLIISISGMALGTKEVGQQLGAGSAFTYGQAFKAAILIGVVGYFVSFLLIILYTRVLVPDYTENLIQAMRENLGKSMPEEQMDKIADDVRKQSDPANWPVGIAIGLAINAVIAAIVAAVQQRKPSVVA